MLETRSIEQVRIIATTKKYERASVYEAPLFGSDRKPDYSFLDVDGVSEKDKKEMIEALGWDETSSEELKHLQVLNPVIMRDKAILLWIQSLSLLAKSKSSVIKSKHRFYIENKEEEAKSGVSSITLKMKALAIAQEISKKGVEKVKDSCRLLGIPVRGLSEAQITNAFLSHADQSSKAFLNMLDDKFKEYKIFIIKLLEKGTIIRTKSGSYYYDNPKNIIALNEQQMIAFIQDKVNANMVNMWAKVVDGFSEHKKDKDEDDDKPFVSTSFSVSKAVEKFNDMADIQSITDFIFGEERPGVIQAANKKMESLKSGEI